MDKETLSNYGWIVICVLVLAVMIALATPFGTFIADGFKATYTGLFETGDSALDVGLSAVGVSNTYECGHSKKASGDHSQLGCGHFACEDCGCVPASCGIEGHWSGDGKDHTTVVNHSDHTYACECTGWIVPEGGTYTMYTAINGKKVYNEGEQLPCGYESVRYDGYVEGDYQYTVRYDNHGGTNYQWGVRVLDKTKTEYGEIRSSINNRNVTLMDETFKNCSNLKVAPTIPNTITNMYGTFYECTSLEDISYLVIPENVTTLCYCFYHCTSLTNVPNTTNATSLKCMASMFHSCSSLSNVTGLVIPSSVTEVSWMFSKCTSMSGTIRMDANPTKHSGGTHNGSEGYTGCFNNIDYGTQNITLTGSSPMLDTIGRANADNYCAECNGTCQKNH